MYGFKTIGDFFDDTITRVFGVDFDSLFSSDSSNGQKVIKRSYTDPRGNTATTITRQSGNDQVTKCYVNGEEREFLPDAIARALENVTPIITDSFDIVPFKIGNKLPDPLVRGSDFPVLDVFLLENRSLRIRVALAGIDPARVGLSFANDYLKINIEAETAEDEIKKAVLVKGIKNSNGKYAKEIYIDPNKYDINGLTYKHEFGIMTITVPGTKAADKPTLIFKEATVKPVEQPKSKPVEDKKSNKKEKVKEENSEDKEQDLSKDEKSK